MSADQKEEFVVEPVATASLDPLAAIETPRVRLSSFWGLPNHLIPFLGTIAAVALALQFGMTFEMHLVAFCLAILTGFGITVGFHRLFVHRSFQTYRPVSWVLAILGCMAGQQPFFIWVAVHRRHHRHSDAAGDPHSPRVGGLWHAHVGWFFKRSFSYDPRDIPDLEKQPDLVWIDRHSFLWYLLGLLLPALICGLASESAYGAFGGFLWGGLYRQFFVQHTTYLVNSLAHRWGGTPYFGRDESRNNLFVALLTLGEGWHNNHHAFPYSARHGLLWWQVDPSWYLIWILARLHLAWNVRLPKSSPNETSAEVDELR